MGGPRAEESQVQRPGRAQGRRGVRGVSPDYGNLTRTHAEEGQAEHSGQAGRIEERGLGGLPRLRNNTAHLCAEKKTSAVAKPSAAKWGASRVSPDCGSGNSPCAKEAKHCGRAERSGKRVPLDYNSNPRSAKVRENSERDDPPVR